MISFLAGIVVGTNCFFVQEYALKACKASGVDREVYAIVAGINLFIGSVVTMLVL